MANYISKVKLPSGGEYLIKDAEARQLIENLGSPTHFAGVTTSALTDGSTTNPIQVGGKSYTAVAGDVVAAGNKEFIFDGTKWLEFGDMSNLGQLAYKDNVVLSKGDGTNVLGSGTTFANGTSQVSFASGAGSDFVTGYNNDAVAPTFTEGAFTPASLASGFYTAGTKPSFTEGAFTPAAIQAGFVTEGSAASFTEGQFTPASLANGFYTAGTAATYGTDTFDGGSLGEASTSAFAVNGVLAAMGSGNDAETLIFSNASTSNAVTAQGAFTPATYSHSGFNGGTPTVIDTTKFNGGSKAADSFTANVPTAIDTTKFSGGSKANDTFNAGTMAAIDVTKFNGGSKAADSFTAGSAATLAKAKALTASVKGTAAAQNITVTKADVKVAVYDDLSVSTTNNS